MPRNPVTHRFGLRPRLTLVFLSLFVLTPIVMLVGVLGMHQTERSFDAFEAQVMPEIAKVLELAEHVARLAAVAPAVADTTSMAAFENERNILRELLLQIRALADSLPRHAGDRLDATEAFADIDRDLEVLIALSLERRELREAQKRSLDTLTRVGDRLAESALATGGAGPIAQSLWATHVAAIATDDEATLGRAQADSEALWALWARSGENRRRADNIGLLRTLSEGEGSVFQLRRRLIHTERRLTATVQLTRSHADELGTRAGAYVAELRALGLQQRDAVRATVRSGVSSLVLLGGAAVAIALIGLVYVNRLLRGIQAMTGNISRLAAGDTTQPTPAMQQRDEIGDLARAFQVFRASLLDRQRLSQGLAEQGRLLDTVFRSIQDGLAVFDSEGALVIWNPRFGQMLELGDDTLRVGLPALEVRRSMPGGASWTREPPLSWLQGGWSSEMQSASGRAVAFEGWPLPGGGIVIACRDLSDQRTAQARLERAQRAEVLGQLTGGIAHDFNNFLLAMLGNLELLQPRLADDAAAAACAARARRAAEAAARLTQRLLAFARPRPADVSVFALGDMLDEMADLIEFSAGSAIEVVRVEGAADAVVRVDRAQLESAVLNLVLNSAAAMPRGGRLELQVVRLDGAAEPAGATLGIRIADSGHGIPVALREKVLEPFFTTKAPGQGSGLGLAIVQAFARQSGGAIHLDSEEGRGTCVEIRLPAWTGELPDSTSALPQPQAVAGMRVLLVEDDADARLTTAGLLAGLQVQVQAVDSEAAAWQALDGEHPGECAFDLLLSDVMLGGGGDGAALARRVAGAWPGLPVVLTSGLPLEADDLPPTRPGCFEFLPKPYGRQQLLAVLARVRAAAGEPATADAGLSRV